MNLVIVESPAKAKTIQKYLGKGFIVKSSFGHVRDLPKTQLGVDIENGFLPHYITVAKARATVADLKKAAKKADMIYFATDEDREGEAIAWHLFHVLKPHPDKAQRITFTEITKSAITRALQNPRPLNMHLVDAQQTRRILDRLVGYELSPLLWKKVRRGLSAGRVQSVAVRLIVEREKERKDFQAQEYWSLQADLKKDDVHFPAMLRKDGDTVFGKLDIKNKEMVDAIVANLQGQSFSVASVVLKDKQKNPLPPFTTSTLQQTAFNRLGFSSKKTMMLAQQLYEGVEFGDHGPTGLITYMRTDSLNIASEAADKAATVIRSQFGDTYALESPRRFTTKTKGAQEAHEAIRPTDPSLLPDTAHTHLSRDQFRLYTLIWDRFMASQMAPALVSTTTVDSKAGEYTFRTTGTTIKFDGYLKVWEEKSEKDVRLPELHENDALELLELKPEQHFTQPPARYSEATLVKALEENGIGRPSTYAPIIDTIQRRGYVVKNDDKRFEPTEIAEIVNTLLTHHFPAIVDIDFTATMERTLDSIAAGEQDWQPVIATFYHPFHETLEIKEQELSKKELTQEKTDEKCPQCGSDVVIKLGRYGKFKACSNFPTCKFTEALGEEKKLQEQISHEKCPQCGKPLALKHGRFGPFMGCTGYPECTFIKKIEKDTGVTCPACGQGKIIEKRSRRGKTFYACNRYPECKQAFWSKPTGESCPVCSSPLVYGPKKTIRCSSKTCTFVKAAEE